MCIINGKMKYSEIENSSLKISKLSLGTMTFGEQNKQESAFKILDYAFDSGINFFDTAEMYPVYPKKETCGLSEKILGEWHLKNKNRDKIIIASKIASKHPKGIGATGLSWIRDGGDNLKFDKKNLKAALDNSLKNLKSDYIDIYQLHWPERSVQVFGQLDYIHDFNEKTWTPFLEIISCLNEFIKNGKIRYYGICNESPWGLSKYLEIAKYNNLLQPVTIQNGYSLVNRVFDISHSEISLRENCPLLAYSPLAGGRLTGKYLADDKPENARYTLWPKRFSRHHTARGEVAIQKYVKIAYRYGLKPSVLANSFVMSRPFVSSSISGATSISHLQENLKSISIDLSTEILNEINEIHLSDPNPCV